MVGVGVVGAGERGVYVLGSRIEEMNEETGMYVRGIYDRNGARAREAHDYLCKRRSRKADGSRATGATETTSETAAGDVDAHEDQIPEIVVYESLDDLLNDEKIEIVLITSYTSAHREQALRAVDVGKRVYLDKPIAANLDDALEIRRAEKSSGVPMMMGFTRRYEPAWRIAFDQVSSGAIGEVQMILLRSIIPYARYLQRWHRFEDLSGGALNDKCSHHFDVFRWFTGSEPVRVQATAGRSATFTPDPTAPSRCRYCDRVCPFRVLPSETVNEIGIAHRMDRDYQTVDQQRWKQPSWTDPEDDLDVIDACVFRPETTIWDYAVSTVTFESGAVATLFWNIFGPPADDQETLEVVGTSGRLVLERAGGNVRVISQYGAREEVLSAESELDSSHFGADLQLIRDIAELGSGGHPPARISDGVEALRLVEATRISANTGGRAVSMSEIPRVRFSGKSSEKG